MATSTNNNKPVQKPTNNGATVAPTKSAAQLPSSMNRWQLEKKEVREKVMIYSMWPMYALIPLVMFDNHHIRTVIALLFIVAFVIYNSYFWGKLEQAVKRLEAKAKAAETAAADLAQEVKALVEEALDDNDDVESVYAFEALNNVQSTPKVSNEVQSAPKMVNEVQSAPKTEGSTSFGFHIPKYGSSKWQKTKEWCLMPVNKNVVNFFNKSPGPITLTYEGNDLKTVKHGNNVYTSFEAMPSKTADILVAARVVLVKLGF